MSKGPPEVYDPIAIQRFVERTLKELIDRDLSELAKRDPSRELSSVERFAKQRQRTEINSNTQREVLS